jgi:hypothetical protein
MRLLTLLLLTAFLSLAAASLRAQAPSCAPENADEVACIADKLCRCRFERGGSMSVVPAGWRWDCGALRPYCHRPPALPPRTRALGGVVIDTPWRLERPPRPPTPELPLPVVPLPGTR